MLPGEKSVHTSMKLCKTSAQTAQSIVRKDWQLGRLSYIFSKFSLWQKRIRTSTNREGKTDYKLRRRNSFQTQDMHEHLTSSLRGVPDSSAGMLLMSRLNSIQSGMPGRRDRGEGKVRKYNTESGPTGLYCQYN